MTTQRFAVAVVLAAMTIAAPIACRSRVTDPAVRAAIESAIKARGSGDDRTIAPLVGRWYMTRDGAPAWTNRRDVAAALGVLADTATHGLDPERYGRSRLEALQQQQRALMGDDNARVRAIAAFDVELTAAMLAAGRDVSVGRTRPEALDREWKRGRTLPDLVSTLDTALSTDALGSWLDELAPHHADYKRMRGWLADAVARGDADAAARVGTLRANLERLRWLPDDLGARQVVVNIPEFMLRAREHDRNVLEMRAIVGKADGHETPVLSGVLESVAFNPYWNIPESIAVAETVPAILNDPGYLARHDMEIVRVSAGGAKAVPADDVNWDDPDALKELRIRQRPGADNALGKIKFPFRNNQAIYLHDTPAVALFDRDSRAFSHGCVRVADPEGLASFVLSGDPEWTPAAIAEAAGRTGEKHVRVPEGVAVHLVYFTVVSGADGGPKYLPDVYGLDRKWLAMQ